MVDKTTFMKFRISLILFLGMLFASSVLWSQGKYSNEFLRIGVGARAQGMGEAVVARTGDVTAGIWNPAGLAFPEEYEGMQIGAMHAEWFAGIGKFDYLGLTLPFSNQRRRMALSVIRFGIDNIPNTLSLYEPDGTVNFDNVSEFSAADYAFFLSYAQALGWERGRMLLGGNIKVIHRSIGPFARSWGFGLDLGLQYRTGAWNLGLVARDIPSTFNGWSFDFTEQDRSVLELTGNEIPISSVEVTQPSVAFGIGRRFQWNQIGIYPELNFLVTTDGRRNTLISGDPFSLDPAFGVELDYKSFLFLRAGVNQFQRELDFDNTELLRYRPGIGVGLKVAMVELDYAFTDLSTDASTYSHIISVLVQLKQKR